MPKPSSKTKVRRQPNVLHEATVRRMLAAAPQPKATAKKKTAKKKRR
jgi:hypothetical protein